MSLPDHRNDWTTGRIQLRAAWVKFRYTLVYFELCPIVLVVFMRLVHRGTSPSFPSPVYAIDV